MVGVEFEAAKFGANSLPMGVSVVLFFIGIREWGFVGGKPKIKARGEGLFMSLYFSELVSI
jgi:hypothetical protein